MEDNMNEKPPELSIAVIEALKAQGYTQSDIARMFGITRQAVSWHKRTYNGSLTVREEAMKHYPWRVKGEQCYTSPYRLSRDHLEYMATAGKGMSSRKLAALRTFYTKIQQGFVLEHDPNLPPEPGFCNKGGFAWRKHRSSDGDLIIRVNEHTQLTEQAHRLWKLPPQLP
jgi:DNA-binding XRE family transcriptional regulator